MHIDATPAEAQTILKAMRAVAAAGAAITAADRASVVAAARYIFQIELSPDLAGLAPRPEELKALAARPDLATEAVCFATVMAFVDGTLDDAKLSAVASLAATLGVKADFIDDIAEVAQGHLRSATAHMIRANLEKPDRQAVGHGRRHAVAHAVQDQTRSGLGRTLPHVA
jgi:tellurite resistance protein